MKLIKKFFKPSIKFSPFVVLLFTAIFFQLALDKGKPTNYMTYLAKNSYIASMPDGYKDETKAYINNRLMGVVPYKGSRPIYIMMAPKWYMEDYIELMNGVGAYGVAYSTAIGCLVFINERLLEDKKKYEETLIHEILHCYGYEHTPYSEDVMYAYGNHVNKDRSYQIYARDIIKNKFLSFD